MTNQMGPKGSKNMWKFLWGNLRAFYNYKPWTRVITFLVLLIVLGVPAYRFAKWSVSEAVRIISERPASTLNPTVTPDLKHTPTPISTVRVPPEWVDYTIKDVTAPDNLRHYLTVIVAIIFAYFLTAVYFGHLYQKKGLLNSLAQLSKSVINISKPILIDENSDIHKLEKGDASELLLGRPGQATIAPGIGVAFERVTGELRVLGPTGNKSARIPSFDNLYRIIDLCDRCLIITVTTRTRDGIAVSLRKIGFAFSVFRGPAEIRPETPFDFDELAVTNLIREYWLEGDWQLFVENFIASNLRQFVARHSFDELFPGTPTASLGRLKERFLIMLWRFQEEFNQQASARGVHIEWMNLGICEVPGEKPFPSAATEDSLFKTLCDKVKEDRKMVEWLIENDCLLAPWGNLTIWKRNVIYRWIRNVKLRNHVEAINDPSKAKLKEILEARISNILEHDEEKLEKLIENIVPADSDIVEWLIECELKDAQKAKRYTLLQNAIYTWIRKNMIQPFPEDVGKKEKATDKYQLKEPPPNSYSPKQSSEATLEKDKTKNPFSRESSPEERVKSSKDNRISELEKKLKTAARISVDQLKGLIDYEKERTPEGDLETWLNDAYNRLIRDNQ